MQLQGFELKLLVLIQSKLELLGSGPTKSRVTHDREDPNVYILTLPSHTGPTRDNNI